MPDTANGVPVAETPEGVQVAETPQKEVMPPQKEVVKEIQKEASKINKLMFHPKKSEKLIISGFSQTKVMAPWNDLTWETWGCNELYAHVPRMDVIFELHKKAEFGEFFGSTHGQKHVDWLKNAKIPIYMAEKYDEIPMCFPYPWDLVRTSFNHGYYLTNSISEMIALALLMEYKEIIMVGVEMAHHTEFETQKPSVEYWIGVADGMYRAKGYPKFWIPEICELLSCPYTYGLYDESRAKKLLRQQSMHYSQARIQYESQMQQNRDVMNQYLGAHIAFEQMLKNRF